MLIKNTKGFTLVELLLAVMILAGAIGGALLLFTSSMISSQQAWDSTVAVSHGEHVLEEMQTRNSLKSILNVNWNQWAKQQKLDTLPHEVVEVTFSDPESNPLEIQVKINWNRKDRVSYIALKTKITK